MLSHEDNELLCRIGPGTPMGNLMRRFWMPALLTQDRVVRTGRITERGLRDWWGIRRPRLAVCAVNPHAGESGLFGD